MKDEKRLWIDYEAWFQEARALTPEVGLWRAVISQLFTDCQTSADCKPSVAWHDMKKGNQMTFGAFVQFEHRELMHCINSEWFEVVCEFAELPVCKVRKACEMILQGEAEFRYFSRYYIGQKQKYKPRSA